MKPRLERLAEEEVKRELALQEIEIRPGYYFNRRLGWRYKGRSREYPAAVFICRVCRKQFTGTRRSSPFHCSQKCFGVSKRIKLSANERGRTHLVGQYMVVYIGPEHSMYSMAVDKGVEQRAVRVHRLNYAEYLGRPLTNGETIHHKNGITTDNRIVNLELRKGQHGPGATHCPNCGYHFGEEA